MLPLEVAQHWKQWVNQVLVTDFISSKFDSIMVKQYFVKDISFNKGHNYNEDVFVAKKEENYVFLTMSKIKFLDVKNYLDLA